MSDNDRLKKLASAKKKLKKFQDSKSPIPENIVTSASSLDKEIRHGMQNNHIFRTPPLTYSQEKPPSSTPTTTRHATSSPSETAPISYRQSDTSPPIVSTKASVSSLDRARSTLDFSSPAALSTSQSQNGDRTPPGRRGDAGTTSGYRSNFSDDERDGQLNDDSNMDLTEVDLQQKLMSYKRSNELLVHQVNEQRRQLMALQDRVRQTQPNAIDQRALKEQLEVHIQTIGILVQEKSELQSSLTNLQKKLSVKEAELLDASVKLSNARKRAVDQDGAIAEFKTGLEKSNAMNRELATERDKYSNKLYETSREADDVHLQNQELQEKLQTKIRECSLLLTQINDLNTRLQNSEIVVRQLSAQGSAASLEKWNEEKEYLERGLQEQREIVSTLVAEKAYFLERENDTREHYDSIVEHLKNKISEQESSENAANERVSELEVAVTNLKEANEASLLTSSDPAESQSEELVTLTNEKVVLESELDVQINENRRLTRLTMENEQELADLQSETRRLTEHAQDRGSLLERAQADQETISRALLQNRQLKEQLDELQSAFVRVSNSSAELAQQLESEQHGGKDVAEKLQQTQVELAELRIRVRSSSASSSATDEQLALAQRTCAELQQRAAANEMDLDLSVTQLEQTKLELHRQVEQNAELQKLAEQPDHLNTKLQEELQSAQDAINTLSIQNTSLKEDLQQARDDSLAVSKEAVEEEELTNEDEILNEDVSYEIDQRKMFDDEDEAHEEEDGMEEEDEFEEEEEEEYDEDDDSEEYSEEREAAYHEISTLQSELSNMREERSRIVNLLQSEREETFRLSERHDEHVQMQVEQIVAQKQRESGEHFAQETEALRQRVASLQHALEIMRENESIEHLDLSSSSADDPDVDIPVLRNAFTQLQKRYVEAMDARAALSDEVAQLDHKNTQLALETETIGEYIALYQTQREALRSKFDERDRVIQTMSNEHTRMQAKVAQLHQLVLQLLAQRSSLQQIESDDPLERPAPEVVSRRLAFHDAEASEQADIAGSPQQPRGLDDHLDSLFGEMTITPDDECELIKEQELLVPASDTAAATTSDNPSSLSSSTTRQQIMQIFEQLEARGEGCPGWISPSARQHDHRPCKNCSERVLDL